VIVREALVSDPRVLEADASAREAAELLTHPHVLSVLVVDEGRLVGCVTKESFIAAAARDADLRRLTAADLADGEVTTIRPDAEVERALQVMVDHDLERLPVTEDGRLVGVVSREPLLRRLAEDEPPPSGPGEDQQQV